MLNTVKGFKGLTTKQQQTFEQTYANHFFHMGKTLKELHTVDKIKEVKYNEQEKCIEVYFEHEWYKYYPNKTWG